ncbi:hypothetical protein HY993_02580 [Candidatus Micrarchaeota archaeon]|nr:hypothetical protein [Candidatus Micrarchaeota archaeon]
MTNKITPNIVRKKPISLENIPPRVSARGEEGIVTSKIMPQRSNNLEAIRVSTTLLPNKPCPVL